MSQRVYITMRDGNAAGSIVMQTGEQVDGDHRTTNGATIEDVLQSLADAGYTLAPPVTEAPESVPAAAEEPLEPWQVDSTTEADDESSEDED